MGELNGEITKRIKEIKNTFSVEELTINISKNILSTLWKKMIIVGSGAIGIEFAYFYNSMGTEF